MCSPHFDEASSLMDKYRAQGDLTDILRPTNRVPSDDDLQQAATSPEDHSAVEWRFPPQHDDYLRHGDGDRDYDIFGDPFSNMKDPLLNELEPMTPSGSSFFGGLFTEDSAIYPFEGKGVDFGLDPEGFPCEIAFSSTLYVSPTPSQSPQKDPSTSYSAVPFRSLENPMPHSEAINPNSRVRLIDTATAMQISAVQNSSMKRRKGQAKKVVCIPAPATANGRSGGEIVPSDLWAWRKYGQKPIKGSPYPRGYYRCSSSKGCSARKQVERSRTDPNMLVITYTSEHNHPWPTQRNALAGSTRATQSANKTNSSNNAAPKISSSSSLNEDKKPRDKRPKDVVSLSEAAAAGSSSAYVKEEMEVTNSETLDEAGMTSLVPRRCDDDDDFLFHGLETMDGGSDPLSFLLNQGKNPKTSTADSDSFGNFFDWSD